MAVRSYEEKQQDRLSNMIRILQTDNSITVHGLKRDLANAYELISQLNDENEELVQNLVSLNRENTELMARLEIEASRSDNLALQVKFLQKKSHKPDLRHNTATLNHTQCLKYNRGDLGSIQYDQISKKSDDNGLYGHKYTQGKVSPLLQARMISRSIPGGEAIDQCITSRKLFMKHQSFVACHSSTDSMERLSLRSRSFSSFNTLSLVCQRNRSFCNGSRKHSEVPFAISRHHASADFELHYSHSPLALVPLKPIINEAWCNRSSSSKSVSNGARPDSVASNRMTSIADTCTASLGNSKLHQSTESNSLSHNAPSSDANLSTTIGNFHLDFVDNGKFLRRKPSCRSLIQSGWCPSLSSLTTNAFNRSALDYSSEHLDYGTDDTTAVNSSLMPGDRRSSISSSACKTFDRSSLDYCDDHLDFGTDDTVSAKSTTNFESSNTNSSKPGRSVLKGIFGRSTEERRKTGTDLLVGFRSRRRTITLRSLVPLLDVLK